MSASSFQVIAGVSTSVMLMLGSWMFMVHAKLAVIASRMADLSEKLEKATEANHELWSVSAQHETRLETHDLQLVHLAERMEGVA